MFYARYLEDMLSGGLSHNKVRLLFGARQTGKTSLLRHLLAGERTHVVNLQDAADRRRYEADPRSVARFARCRAPYAPSSSMRFRRCLRCSMRSSNCTTERRRESSRATIQRTQRPLCLFQRAALRRIEVAAGPVDVESQHRHCRLIRPRLPAPALLRRAAQGFGDRLRIMQREDVFLEVERVAALCHLL